MRVQLALSRTYREKGDSRIAMHYAQKLLEFSEKSGANQYSRDAHFLLYQLFDVYNKNSAYYHLQQYTILKDLMDRDLSDQKLAFYKVKSDREKAEKNITILNEEKKLQQQQIRQQILIKRFLAGVSAGLIVIGVFLFRNSALKRKNEKLESERTRAELKQQAVELEMQALRAQINPHFIFNCLNAINGFILVNESETAADYLVKFSRLIRMVLSNSQRKFISLEEELEMLNLYLYLERLRFTNSFRYTINCDDTIEAAFIFIPPMLLQPFVENAVWHGLTHKEGNGELLIKLRREDDTLYCSITDNGVGRKKSAMLKSKSVEKNKSMGMQITTHRIALLNLDENSKNSFEIYDLEDENGNAAGTTVSLKINIKEAPADIAMDLPEKININD